MAWDDVLIPMVRNLINDTSDAPTYDDDRIEQAIMTAGMIVTNDFEFDVFYTFSFTTPDIDPDPTLPDTLDNEFIALVALKAACILSTNAYQLAVNNAISVRDGSSSVSTGVGLGGYADLLKNGPCGAYASLLEKLSVRAGMNNGGAVLGPHSCGDYGPYYGSYYDTRSFYDYVWGY